MSISTILFVSHPEKQCGVNQFGQNVGSVLERSERYLFVFRECSGKDDFDALVEKTHPSAIIYNHHPATMRWVTPSLTRGHQIPQIGILHEVTQRIADHVDNYLFDFYIAPDPTLVAKNPIIFKTGRLIPCYRNERLRPEVPTIGSFGFGTKGKGFQRVIRTVEKEYDRAIVRLHIPFSAFVDADGKEARRIEQECAAAVSKPDIQLHVTHDFLTQSELLDFLAGNTVNAFFYDDLPNRGISSAVDLALAVDRPLALTRTSMFRHVFNAHPSIFIEDATLREIAETGDKAAQRFRNQWTDLRLLHDYEQILDQILSAPVPRRPLPGLPGKIVRRVKRVFRYCVKRRANKNALRLPAERGGVATITPKTIGEQSLGLKRIID